MDKNRKIDDHLHLIYEKMEGSGQASMQISTAEEMLSHLDELGIGHGILMSGGEECPVGNNENNRKICEAFPERYSWMCNVDARNAETVYERLKTYKEAGAVGIGELMINEPLDSPFLAAVFEAAQKLKLPVLFHMSPKEGFQYGVVDEPGLPLLERVLQAYPELTVIGHSQPFWHEISGDAGASLEERNAWGSGPVKAGGRLVELFEKYPKLYGDLSANSGGCAVMRDEDFGLAFLERFQDRLIFGTDMVNTEMVFPLGEWLDAMKEKGRLSAEVYDKICFGNAVGIFGLEKKAGCC